MNKPAMSNHCLGFDLIFVPQAHFESFAVRIGNRKDHCFGGLASFTIAPCSSLMTSTENFVTASRSFVLRLE